MNITKVAKSWLLQFRLRLLQRLTRWGVREQTLLVMLSFLVGVLSGGATWLFKVCTNFVERNYMRPLALVSHATSRPAFWVLLPLIPAGGAVMLVLWRRLWPRRDARLDGLAGVLYSLTRESGRLRFALGLETMIGSALTIGSGGSAGPEAPIAVIGSSIGSTVAAMVGISRRNMPVLIGCGAAGGISAVFGAPIAGVLFAVEVLLRDFSVSTLTPVVISSVAATTMYEAIVGSKTTTGLFQMPVQGSNLVFTFHELPYYLVLGLFCGLLAVFFTRCMGAIELLSQRISKKVPAFFLPIMGAALSGACGIILLTLCSHDPFLHQRFSDGYIPIFADGYPTIHRALDPGWYASGHIIAGQGVRLTLEFLAVVCLLKVVATALTLGSGGAGGVFAPALFIGATGGGALGIILHHYSAAIDPTSYALVGMGAVLAAATQAPLTAIILLFELTRNYGVMLPAMLATVTATVCQQFVVGESLYTLPLRHMGVKLGSAVGISAMQRLTVDQLTLDKADLARPDEPLSSILDRSYASDINDFVVTDSAGHYLGMLTINELKIVMLEPESAPLLLVGEVVRTDIPPLRCTTPLDVALEMFSRHEVARLPVLDNPVGHKASVIRGLLSRAELMRRYYREMGG